MPTKYEYYDVNDDTNASVYGDNWEGQTFTPAIAHRIESIKLYLHKIGSPNTPFVSSIRATSGGTPSGGDLTNGTISSSTISGTSSWIETSLTPYNLSASTKYAIVCRLSGGDGLNYVNWRMDNGGGTYSGGNAVFSSNAGVSWADHGGTDIEVLFEDWGSVGFIPKVLVM